MNNILECIKLIAAEVLNFSSLKETVSIYLFPYFKMKIAKNQKGSGNVTVSGLPLTRLEGGIP